MGVPNYYENYIYNQDVNKLGPNDYVKVPGYNMDSNRGHIQMKDYLGALDAYERNNPDYLEALAAQKMEAKMNAFNDELNKLDKKNLNNSELLSKSIFSLPIYPNLKKRDQLKIIKEINNFVKNN